MSKYKRALTLFLTILKDSKSDTPYTFIEIKVTADSKNRKINEVRLWQTTGTTMVAYRRKGETVISILI